MAKLEDLSRGASVKGILPDQLVTVVDVKWIGNVAVDLTYKDAAGRPANELLYRDRESSIQIVAEGSPWSFDADGALFRLVSEAQRIRLAYLFDPLLAVHTSMVEHGRGALSASPRHCRGRKTPPLTAWLRWGVVKARGGKVQLIKREELDTNWDQATDRRLTVWETAQHLIHTQQEAGKVAAAALMHQLGGIAETARDLAYRLYNICEHKKWAEEALAYNGLAIAWPELTKLALAERTKTKNSQQEMF